MRRLERFDRLATESMEYGSDGLTNVSIPGPEIRVGGNLLFLLETRFEVKQILDAACYAFNSAESTDDQEERFRDILEQFPDQTIDPIREEEEKNVLSDLQEKGDDDLTPLETLIVGCAGLVSLMEDPAFGDKSVGVVFGWTPPDTEPACFVEGEDDLPLFVLKHGSLSATLVFLKGLYTTGKWILAAYGWVRPNFTTASQASSWFVEQLRARAMTHGHGAIPLDRLDHPNTNLTFDPQKNSMAIVYVHGLFSTDAKTFDGFRDAWSSLRIRLYTDGGLDRSCVESAFAKVGHLGFPHDTFCGIDRSGQALADALINRFESESTNLALVTHSRGGLVARRAIQCLKNRNRGWENRIRFFATFGTPHTGVNLAALPGRYEGSYLLLMGKSDRLIALDMLFCYLKLMNRIEGIDDLQPVGNSVSTFIEDLENREKQWGSLDTWAVYGVAPQRYIWRIKGLVSKAVRSGIDTIVGKPNDLVVPQQSAMAAPNATPRRAECDHFDFFSQSIQMENTAREIMRAFGLDAEINNCTGSLAPDISFEADGDDVIIRVGATDLLIN